MKVKLFTHTDLDGVGCAIIAKQVFEDLDVSYCNYDEIDYCVSKFIAEQSYRYDLIFITDISVDEGVAKEINEYVADKTLLIDHHPTAMDLNKYKWANVSPTERSLYTGEDTMKSSGTSLLFDYLWNNYELNSMPLQEFIEKVRRYDTWEWSTRFNDTHAKRLNDLLYILGRERFVERFAANPSIKLTDDENLVLDLEQDKINHYIKSKQKELKKVKVLSYTAGVVFAEQYHSELGNELAKANEDIDFVVMINPASQKISYRGIKEDVDLGKDVAKVFGGGGHPRAAGSQIHNANIDIFITDLFK